MINHGFTLIHETTGAHMCFRASGLQPAIAYAREVWQCDTLDIRVQWGA
jgi:hypothetical protein